MTGYSRPMLERVLMRLAATMAPVLAWWRGRGPLTQDAMLAVVLALLAFVPSLASNGVDLAELPHRPLDGLGIGLGLAQALPLVLRRVAPLACLSVIAAAFVADQLLAYPSSFASLGLLAALYAAGAYLDRRLAPAAILAGTLAYVGICVAMHAVGSPELPMQYVTFFLVLAGCWAVGWWVQRRRIDAETRRAHAAQLAVTEERARIAGELHDVITHHVTAMVVQSDAAQVLLDSAPERAAAGLDAIGQTGRRALGDLRRLLDVLDGGTASPGGPAIDDLDELVELACSTGQPVRMLRYGSADAVPDDVALAAYRVVQESLTNAVKHAPGRDTVVRVDRADHELTILVSNTRPDTACRGIAELGGGRGIAGLRARVDAVGGELAAEPGADGDFVVRAHLPLRTNR